MDLPSTKPYLLRALWEWCCDNGFTPYIAVQVDGRTRVPREFIREGQIVLNIGSEATNKLHMGNDLIEFQARFGGVARELSVPVEQVSAIYARENGAGMAFEVGESVADGISEQVDSDPAPADGAVAAEAPKPGGRPFLQRVK